jgi:putative aldouronate transport system substrate-binding protein
MKIKYWKRSLLSLVALVVVVSTAACSSGNSNDSSNNGNKAANNKAEETPVVEQLSADTPGWQQDTSPITFDWYLNYAWFGSKWGVDPTSKYITGKTGVDLNFIVPAGNENEKLNTLIASGNLPDFITLAATENSIQQMIDGELVLPLNTLADEYDPYFFTASDPAKLSWYTQPDGNVYVYPNASSSPKDYAEYGDTYVSNQTFLVRKDMYEAIGSPDMRTHEGFLKALQLAKEKYPSVNGQPLIPLGLHEFTEKGNESLQHYIQNFLAIPKAKDGQIYDRSTDPEYVSWLKTMRQANQDGLLAKDIFIDKRPQMEEKISQGRYFAMLYQRTDLAAQLTTMYANDPNTVYIAVDGPANTNLDIPSLDGPGISGWTVTLISKNVKDKARAIRFLSYLNSEEGVKDLYLGEKGVTYDTIDGKDQFLPDALKLLNSDRTAFDKQYGASDTFWMLMNTNISAQWRPETVEPFKQLEDWTKGKTVSASEFELLNPKGNSPEGIISTKLELQWGKVLPQLLMAESEAEFDTIWNAFQDKRKKDGLDQVTTFQQAKYEQNVNKLKEFLK